MIWILKTCDFDFERPWLWDRRNWHFRMDLTYSCHGQCDGCSTESLSRSWQSAKAHKPTTFSLGGSNVPTLNTTSLLCNLFTWTYKENHFNQKCLGWFSAAPRHHSHSVLRNLRSHALQQDNLAPWYLGTRPVTSCRNQSPFGSWWRKFAETFHMCLNHQHPPTKKHVHIHVYVYTYIYNLIYTPWLFKIAKV